MTISYSSQQRDHHRRHVWSRPAPQHSQRRFLLARSILSAEREERIGTQRNAAYAGQDILRLPRLVSGSGRCLKYFCQYALGADIFFVFIDISVDHVVTFGSCRARRQTEAQVPFRADAGTTCPLCCRQDACNVFSTADPRPRRSPVRHTA